MGKREQKESELEKNKKEKTLKSLTEIKVEVDKLAKNVIAPSFTLLISTT